MSGSDQVDATDDMSKSCCSLQAGDRPVNFGGEPRRVHFSQTSPCVIDYVPRLTEMSVQEKHALWWNRQEYEDIGFTARNICKEVRRHGANMTHGLEAAYRQAQQVARTVDESQMEEALQNLTLDMGLSHWCTHGHSRRGLERGSSRYLGDSKASGADQTKKHIVRNQRSLTPEELRLKYLQLTRCSRLFARLMGHADAAATTVVTTCRRWSDLGGAAALQIRRLSYQRASSLPQQLPLRGLVRATL